MYFVPLANLNPAHKYNLVVINGCKCGSIAHNKSKRGKWIKGLKNKACFPDRQ